MNHDTRPLKEHEIIDASKTLETLAFLVGKRVRVTFNDTAKRTAKLTRLYGHTFAVNGQSHTIVDALELDGESGDLAEMVRIVRVDNLEATVTEGA